MFSKFQVDIINLHTPAVPRTRRRILLSSTVVCTTPQSPTHTGTTPQLSASHTPVETLLQVLGVVLDVLLPVVLGVVAVVERGRLLGVVLTEVGPQQDSVVDVQLLTAAGAG